MEQNLKVNELLQLLAQVWYLWRKTFPQSETTAEVLRLVQELQIIIFSEK